MPALPFGKLRQIERLVFHSAPAKRSDVLFIFGADDGPWDAAARLFVTGLSQIVLTTGRAGSDYYVSGQPKGVAVRNGLIACGVPNSAIIVEDRSDNTLENVVFGKAALERAGVNAQSIRLFCKAHHAGRAWRTPSRWFAEVTLSCSTFDATVDGVAISANDWLTHESSRRRVYGEFQRMLKYAERGDIFGDDLRLG